MALAVTNLMTFLIGRDDFELQKTCSDSCMPNAWLQYSRLMVVMLSIVLCFPYCFLCEILCDGVFVSHGR